MKNVAVIMSVYKNDTVKNTKLAIDSIVSQESCHVYLFIQVDGLVSAQLRDALEEYGTRTNITIDFQEQNKGLAYQLNIAIERVKKSGIYFDYLARMDADDISLSFRFKKQIEYLENKPQIAVLGSDILEFFPDGREQYKKMESNHSILKKNIIKKCPLNHPSVIFNLNVISINEINYNVDMKNTQDYYLWVSLLSQGFIFSNINEPLLRFRVDANFNKRRGLSKLKNDLNARLYALNKLKIHSLKNYVYILLLVLFRLSPSPIKTIAYKYLR
ncbi:glycosyltransferase [Vibrio sp. 1865]|uniref:glycosyltransferase n=1 Tax=unclassified Vibrio TaxID=2614977 RepID=UPI00296403EC|nr:MULTISPECIES: glycosyltransferase [unclassified Vibrio]MDW2092050.1 glycosyltransferase [Vibrio sp. 1866]MDW3102123.1 glycosyltransferase [Vibrio sp. 1874]MDW3199809.1 glycosyltransferase [Vibrio sp. 1865]